MCSVRTVLSKFQPSISILKKKMTLKFPKQWVFDLEKIEIQKSEKKNFSP